MSKPIKVDAAVLTEQVAWIAKAKPQSSYTPVLNAVHVSAVVGAIVLRRTDYEQFRETVVPAEGGGQVSVLVDPVKLAALLKGSEHGSALVEVTDTGLSVTLAGRTIKLRSSGDIADYPDWPTFIPGDTGAAILTTGQVARALTSAGVDDTLPMLTGVRFEDGAMVTTDRFRLTRVTYTAHGKPMAALVPASVLRAFTRGAELVTIDHGAAGSGGVEGGLVHVSSGQRSIIARVLDHDFPKWKQLIPDPEAAKIRAVIRRVELLDAIGTGQDVTLTITAPDGEAVMAVTSTDRDGDVEVEQQVRVVSLLCGDGLPFTVRLNSANLRGCLKGVASGAVQLEAISSDKPIVLRGLGDNDLHLVMPIRIAA